MNKKEKRIALRQNVEKAVVRDEQNRRIRYTATNPVPEVGLGDVYKRQWSSFPVHCALSRSPGAAMRQKSCWP